MNTYRYTLPFFGHKYPEDAIEYKSKEKLNDHNLSYLVDDFWGNHDGWEYNWPLTFDIWDDDDNFIGRYSIEMEAEPLFYCAKLPDPL